MLVRSRKKSKWLKRVINIAHSRWVREILAGNDSLDNELSILSFDDYIKKMVQGPLKSESLACDKHNSLKIAQAE